ncbi:MAG: zinc ribbon domain-containing protein [Candidatus Kerfeldbacteria bacterium]|nr:zinc ribbon domain-containing protein [Candidatus Kerfeldbacteria bacterium]
MNQVCESCMMPFKNDTGKRESEKYCSKCYSNGQLHGEGMSLKEFQAMCYNNMIKDGISPLKAKFFTFMIRFAPRWKK